MSPPEQIRYEKKEAKSIPLTHKYMTQYRPTPNANNTNKWKNCQIIVMTPHPPPPPPPHKKEQKQSNKQTLCCI